MTTCSNDMSQRKIALAAGYSFLAMTVAAIFAILFVFEKIKVRGDALATYNNIQSSKALFIAGFCSLVLVLICDVVVSWALYLLLKRVNKDISLLAMLLRLTYAAILGAALINLSIVLNFFRGNIGATALEVGHIQASVLLFFNAFFDGLAIGLVVFGFHLLVLGYLVFKSDFIPKIIGILIMAGALCYIAQNVAVFAMPNYEDSKALFEMYLGLPMALGELSFAFWLLLKGGKHPTGEQP